MCLIFSHNKQARVLVQQIQCRSMMLYIIHAHLHSRLHAYREEAVTSVGIVVQAGSIAGVGLRGIRERDRRCALEESTRLRGVDGIYLFLLSIRSGIVLRHVTSYSFPHVDKYRQRFIAFYRFSRVWERPRLQVAGMPHLHRFDIQTRAPFLLLLAVPAGGTHQISFFSPPPPLISPLSLSL